MTTTHADAAPTRSLVGRYFRQLGIDTQYVLIGFPIGMVTFVVGLSGFALGISTAIIWVGLPILVGTLMLSRGFAMAERARIGPVLGRRMPHPRYKRVRGEGALRRTFGPLSDGQTWLDLLHAIFRFIPNTLGFCFVVTWWSIALAGLTVPLWDWALPHTPDNHELHELLGFQDTMGTRVLFNFSIGVFFAGTLYWVVRGAALMEAHFAKGLLVSVSALREQIAVAEEARDVAQQQKAAAVSAEAVALRKLERDIHDGPQQRLVRLAMDLGRAEQQFTADPDRARAIVAEALAQTRETLDELRALSRGIAPPILVDRGLRAALTALAGRCTIPVDLDAPPLDRLEPAVESTAYFVVAEALTNVAKHSYANEVQVSVQRIATGLIVTVADDGVGGASLAKGHGLAGLDDRVRAAGGVLSVDSPQGEGTRLTAALPL
ncbi:sensor histidine kinase [Actinoplanes utahensis]|uniref:histidine kinase n=1 Tax=Actinoplanes utahensis TaxID=1869 RepID=A0A0A6USN7_ACTUT|nr:sensor histidine kinase [Actinoplanes utahensis]KHD78436.1 histidine kinase [Actinoplanes utahensis]GIF31920.1 histidine kinase [Actinoplanes utahensis]